jgi:hypothetical protein
MSSLVGGDIFDEMHASLRLIGGLLEIAREKSIVAYITQKKTIPAQLFQTTYPIFRKDAQYDECFTVFNLPSPVIQLDASKDSIGYIGGMNGVTPYMRSHDQSDYANSMQHPIMASIANREPVCVYVPEFSLVQINKTPGRLPKRIMVNAVFVDPTKVPEYNEEIDDYPITQEIFSMAKDYMLQVDIKQLLATTTDPKNKRCTEESQHQLA